MARAGRDYLNCRYEPVEQSAAAPAESSKTTAATNGSLPGDTQTQELCCTDANDAIITKAGDREENTGRVGRERTSANSESSSGSSSPSSVRSNGSEKPLMPSMAKPVNYFKWANPIWYLIIPPALAFTFVSAQQATFRSRQEPNCTLSMGEVVS